ncbi:PilZ domain-containing protein [Sphingomonas sp.]|uniref:PilZ domain-containing protein n=1 Tax=Sphingomonas sp. TaxID=28214 RepID=UPI002B877FA4|nr:PilZ domain-containing protein [Sphingomonas sp.]HWK34998.1 PilZ domain-containing protein [Sphingomonas sp.]
MLPEARTRRAAPQEVRATLRKPVRFKARLREGAAVRFDILVHDLSITGLRGETALHLRVGATVWVTLPGLSGLETVVVWRRGDQFGARFVQPLHPAVFEHIVEAGR